ncbi:MAG TPA: hypothetical protein VFG63_07585 [Nocardioidaceae bacterium]|nr:hypothetical protein [Nocardioidaceae bacterium]
MSTPRRGRPPGRLVDPTPSDGAAFHGEVRIGWLLRSWRLAAAPETSARSFATVLIGLGRSADASRVSRWETGQLPAPLDVIGGYEQALGVAEGSLAALAVSTRRLPETVDEQLIGLPTHRFSVPDLEHALDTVVDGSPTGADWFRFAVLVASRPDQVTLAMSTWRSLTTALVKQIGLSIANAYITRVEAAILLMHHPRAKRALVQAIGAYVMRPDSLLVVDLLALLTEMADPPASDLVLRLLEQQPPGPVLNGAVWAASSKVTRRQFSGDELDRLERAVARLVLREGVEAGGLFHRLADLVAVLPGPARDRLGTAGESGRGLPRPDPQSAQRWALSQVGTVCEALTQPDEYVDDPLLERLVEEAVFHSNAERRFQAALTMAFSPHRERLASACAGLVEQHLDGTRVLEPLLAERVMLLLTFFGTEHQRALVHRVIRDGPANLLGSALLSAAHLPPTADRHAVAEPPAATGRPDLTPIITARIPTWPSRQCTAPG